MINRVKNPHQPTPVLTLVARMPVGGRTVSAVARVWMPGDSSRCRLCEVCHARKGVCLVLTNRAVPDREARLYGSNSSNSDNSSIHNGSVGAEGGRW